MTRRRELMSSNFDWKVYVRDLLDLAMPGLARISVCVPNYNYARYMSLRLRSVFAQNYPAHEVLVLDDCSKDDSVSVIRSMAMDAQREIRLVLNETNSGSVFAQWRKAAELATGDFVWIAEADDLSDPEFLGRLVEPMMNDPSICMAFSDSKAIDTDGAVLGASYKSYFAEIEVGALSENVIYDAVEFAERFMSVRNVILNVSSVLWRRDVLLRALNGCGEELGEYKMAGDWRLYLHAMQEPGAKIAYDARPLNVHRRHAESVTHALDAERHVSEIKRIHDVAAQRFTLPAAILRNQTTYREAVTLQLSGRSLLERSPKIPRGRKAIKSKERSGRNVQ
jgi:glycosyltransferase involved in cell wall biosynthesis